MIRTEHEKQPVLIFNGDSCAHSQADGYAEGDTVLTVNSFCRDRHTKESRFSYVEGDSMQLLEVVSDNWQMCKPGYREGVVIITVPPDGFYSGVCTLKSGDALQGAYKPRREGEEPRKTIGVANGEKLPAKLTEVVLYSSSVLAENNDNDLPADSGDCWEVVSINASPTLGEAPIHPETLMHNHFGSSGGTRSNLTDEEFVAILKHSFSYWKDKALLGE